LTKIHEENARGTLAEVMEHFSKKEIKGEIVIVLEGATTMTKKNTLSENDDLED
jgi:16S rRNA (cytidine1402-2'-O)-methyltransferase